VGWLTKAMGGEPTISSPILSVFRIDPRGILSPVKISKIRRIPSVGASL
jgi:hypothetical protein